MNVRATRGLSLGLAAWLGACNAYDASLVGLTDAGAMDAPSDAAADAAPDAPSRDASTDGSTVPCALGFHRCGDECVRDQPNTPELGCALGCGDACPAPAFAVATCTTAGRCDFECDARHTRNGDVCDCLPLDCDALGVECGNHPDGCDGTTACGACPGAKMCSASGQCACPSDASEPNNALASARLLGTFNDYDDRSESWTRGWSGTSDEDWFRIVIEDGYDFGNPRITVLVEGPRPSDGYGWDLTAALACSNAMNASTCVEGTAGSEWSTPSCGTTPASNGRAQVVLQAECTGTDDDAGTLVVRVRPRTIAPNMCPSYVVTVTVT